MRGAGSRGDRSAGGETAEVLRGLQARRSNVSDAPAHISPQPRQCFQSHMPAPRSRPAHLDACEVVQRLQLVQVVQVAGQHRIVWGAGREGKERGGARVFWRSTQVSVRDAVHWEACVCACVCVYAVS